jgi:hypothetical protein
MRHGHGFEQALRLGVDDVRGAVIVASACGRPLLDHGTLPCSRRSAAADHRF